jgi:AcrR family transcriptional regulator
MTPAGDPSRPRRRDADKNLDVLLDAAARVLADDPAATMADIAAASGLGRVTAWRHVGSREELLGLLQQRARAEISETLQGILGDRAATPADVGRAVEALAAIGSRYRVLFVVQPGGELRRGRREALAPLARAIARGQDVGNLRADVAPELAAMLASAAAQAALQEAAGRPRALKRAVTAARRVTEAGLGSATAASGGGQER